MLLKKLFKREKIEVVGTFEKVSFEQFRESILKYNKDIVNENENFEDWVKIIYEDLQYLPVSNVILN